MAGLLGDVFSFGDSLKRKARGLLADPVGTLQQFVGNEADRINQFGQLSRDAATEWRDRIPSGQSDMGSNETRLMGLLADSYSPVAMAMPDKAKAQMRSVFDDLIAGKKTDTRIANGVVLTDEQKGLINDAYAKLTGGKQPPNGSNSLDIRAGHIYDSRISGKVKPSGKTADSFAPNQVVDWMSTALDDSATVGVNKGVPHLQNLYTDPVSGSSYVVRAPISGDYSTGVQWVSGLIPEGVFSSAKNKKP